MSALQNVLHSVFSRSAPAQRSAFVAIGLILLATILLSWHWSATVASRSLSSRDGKFPTARLGNQLTIRPVGKIDRRVGLGNGRDLQSPYQGPEQIQNALIENQADPRSLASADFDEDGVPDLVSGYWFDGRGILTIHRGNVDAIYPNTPEAKQRRANGSFTDAPFLSPALAVEVGTSADFVAAGDFNADGHWDVGTASRGGSSLHFIAGDGRGDFGAEELLPLTGRVTALTAGDVNRRDGLTDLIVGIDAPEESRLCVFEGPRGALHSTPEIFSLPASAAAVDTGEVDNRFGTDIAVASGNHLILIHGRDRKLSLPEEDQAEVGAPSVSDRTFGFRLRSVVTGSFTGDGRHELALLSEDGALLVLSQPGIDVTEWSNIKRAAKASATGRSSQLSRATSEGNVFGPSLPLSDWSVQVATDQRWPAAQQLIRTRTSSVAADTMAILGDPDSLQLNVVWKTPPQTIPGGQQTKPDNPSTSFAVSSMTAVTSLASVLPMRLDEDALSDLVVLRRGTTQPSISLTTKDAIVPPLTPDYSTFTNSAFYFISAFFSIPGKADTYPSTITVSGVSDPNSKVRVKLNRFGSSKPSVVDLLLVSPAGQKVLLMSDVGGNSQFVSGLNITFDDTAPTGIGSALATGAFKPTDVDDGATDAFPSPAPSPPYAGTLSAFNGSDLNGDWKLYGIDDGGGGTSIQSRMEDGWTLIFGDDPPSQDFVVTNINDGGAGSLRQAILDANNKPGADRIIFSIDPPTGGAKTITPATSLPNVTEAVTIDATTQPGFAGKPIIEINGANVGADGLVMLGGNSVIRGLVINRFGDDGLLLLQGGNNIVENNYIGTDLAGNVDLGNTNNGINIDTANNRIGGTTAAARNVISGNNFNGILFGTFYSDPAENNLIQGNYIGTNAAGTALLGNQFNGISTNSSPGSPNNTIGGTIAGARNIISGSIFSRVDISYAGSSSTLVQGNYIGTDVTGTVDLNGNGGPNDGGNGVELSAGAGDCLIGGTTPAARNLLSGNWYGVFINTNNIGSPPPTRNLVQGNFIGTKVDGTSALPNFFSGVRLIFGATSNTVGGAVVEARNIISGNKKAGIQIGEINVAATFTNIIQNNYIGTDVTGNNPLPNGDNVDPSGGIIIPANADGDRIEKNRIAYNLGSGIRITNVSGNNQPGIRILIADNEIFANTKLGIDLGDVGITPNDSLDADSGPNLLQNFPELTSISALTSPDANSPLRAREELSRPNSIGPDALTVSGTLNSAPNATFTVHWYFSADSQCVTNQASSRPLVTGKVPGVTTNGSGIAQFNFPFDFPVGINNGIINCTATDAAGNTSEFSACLQVNSTPPPAVSLDASSYSTNESVGSKTITVTRTGSTAAACTVNYATSDTAAANPCNMLNGAASSRCDYIPTLGTLSFAAGEASKTISIPFIDDAYAEGTETLTVTLSNPAGTSLGSPGSAVISIVDNETQNGANPISQSRYYVRLHYLDFLNREPDTGGWDFWTNQTTSCGNPDPLACRINVSASFFLSIEFKETGYLVERTYKTAYGDADGASTFPSAHTLKVPVVRFAEFLSDTQKITRGVVVLAPGWEALLESNKVAFFNDFVQRSRFTTAFPTTMTPTLFVDQLNQRAGNVLSASERTTAINLFGGAGDTTNVTARARALRQVAEDVDLVNAEINRAFVLMQYFGYLRRNPNDPQDSDYSGFDFWLTKLNQFGGNYITAEMVKAFITSIEYNQRFGP